MRADSYRGSVFSNWALGLRVLFGVQPFHAALVAGVQAVESPHKRIGAQRAVERVGTCDHPETIGEFPDARVLDRPLVAATGPPTSGFAPLVHPAAANI